VKEHGREVGGVLGKEIGWDEEVVVGVGGYCCGK